MGWARALRCSVRNTTEKAIRRQFQAVEGIALRFSLVISSAFAVLALTVPEWMMRVFTADPELIGLGASYLRVLSICYLCWGIIEVYLSVLRSIGRATVGTALKYFRSGHKCAAQCGFYLRPVRRAKAWGMGVAIATSVSRFWN